LPWAISSGEEFVLERNQIPRQWLVAILLSGGTIGILAAGCSSDSGRYGVQGKVTFKGQPVEEGTITFEDPATGQVNSSPLAAGGAYSMELPAGDFKVSVAPPLVEVKSGADTPPDLVPKSVANIPKKYWVQEKSGLSAKVAKEALEFNFELQP
jgi:hypothetical protein